jgi:hypothetical protein
MAYLDTREPITAAPHLPLAASIEAGFDRREWEVIVLAREDGLASLREPSRLARLLDRLFGAGINRRLANPRLEALRRFAVLAWHHGYTLPVSAMKAFKEAGFSMDHAELLLASIAVGRTRHDRSSRI